MFTAEYYQKARECFEALAKDYVKKAQAMIEQRIPNTVITGEVVMGGAAQMIVVTADEWKADLIVVGSHGRGFWSRSLLGSVCDAVVHHAPCSVLVVRSAGSEESADGLRKTRSRDEH